MKIETILKQDGIGVLPTDTLYGVVGSALSKKAVQRIYDLKGRDENKPFIILISHIGDLALFGVKLSKEQALLLKKLWSEKRPTSVIVPVTQKKFEYLHRGTHSLAFRLPKNKSLSTLLKKTGPLVAPSANPQGMTPAKNVTEAKKYFSTNVDFYQSGTKKEGKPSKIVSLLGLQPEVLRK